MEEIYSVLKVVHIVMKIYYQRHREVKRMFQLLMRMANYNCVSHYCYVLLPVRSEMHFTLIFSCDICTICMHYWLIK